MPEGPSIVILKEDAAKFAGRKILRVEGNTAIDKDRLQGLQVAAVRSWGKHFLLQTPRLALRVHFMLWGSWRIDERKPERPIRLGLGFTNGELNLYSCSVQLIEAPLDEVYDWRADVMSDVWNPALARQKLLERPDMLACDALLDQSIFAGVGNIIKNEVLFRIRMHPLSAMGALPREKMRELVQEARRYSFDFYGWKRQFVLRKHWLAHAKKICPRCDIPFTKAHLGHSNRRSFFCENCQVRY